MTTYIVTVMAQDRVGIVRDVSHALASLGGNITHISQTVMRGYFTLILSVDVPKDRTLLQIRQAVERAGDVGEFEVNVRPFVEPPIPEPRSIERFTLSLRGADRSGLIAAATSYLAENNINIEDVYAYVHDGKALILAQVSVPAEVDVEELQIGLQEALKDFDVAAHLQHENIFKATSEVQPVIGLEGMRE